MKHLLLALTALLVCGCSSPAPDASPQAAPVASIPAWEKPIYTLLSMDEALPAAELKTETATTTLQPDGSLLYRNTALKFRLRIPAELKDSVYIRDAMYADNPEVFPLSIGLPPRKVVLIYVVQNPASAVLPKRQSTSLRYYQIPPLAEAADMPLRKAYQILCTDPQYEKETSASLNGRPSWDAQGSACYFHISDAQSDDTPAVRDMLVSFHTDTDPTSDTPITYRNEEYGFELTIPNTWDDYRVEVSKGKPDGKYPPGATFRFNTRQTDILAKAERGDSIDEETWDMIYINCTDPKEWYDPDAEESYYPKEGENKKCVFTMNRTNGSLFNILTEARMYTVLRSFRAIPVP